MVPSLPMLALISGLSSFSLAIVLPALPALAERFDTSYAGIQFLVSAYLLGLAVSQPLWGHITDRLGRRPVVLWGFALYVVSSLGCLAATSLETLTLLRALQAAGGSAGTVVARAVIRDSFDAQEGARAMSWVTIGLGSAPVIAPIIGGLLLSQGETHNLFVIMAGVGALLWLVLFFKLPETLAEDAPRPAWANLHRSYSALLKNRGFVGYTAVYGLIQGGFFAFLAVGAAVFLDSFGMGPKVFGTIWGFMGTAYVIGAIVTARLSTSQRRPMLLPTAIYSTLLLALLVPAIDVLMGTHVLGVTVPLFLMMALAGGITPIVMAGAVYQIPALSGTAAGLSSAIGMSLGGSFTMAAGLLYNGQFTPIALLIALAGVLTFLSWLPIRRL